MEKSFDVTVIGAGIVGLATAMKLAALKPDLHVAVVEKEDGVARHQTGHNSGVIHSGIYYRPGSLKARLCVSGAQQLVRFCEEQGVPYDLCGKVVIATTQDEVPRLEELHRRGKANGVPDLRLLGPGELSDIEPHASCAKGLHVPGTGIVDFGRVARAYAEAFEGLGGELYLNHRVLALERTSSERIRVETDRGALTTRVLINCAGLYADRIARLSGIDPPCQIVPFRGEYYRIAPKRATLVRNLIYPVPDPRFPFLGVHFTRMIDGKVEAGPNAVLAWAREGYGKGDIRPDELFEVLSYKGFWHLARRFWRQGIQEMARSHSRRLFARALQKLVPEVRAEDLLPGGAGVRAQALGKRGALLDDFVVIQTERMIHVLNAPSPAATSSLAIADHIIETASLVMSDTHKGTKG